MNAKHLILTLSLTLAAGAAAAAFSRGAADRANPVPVAECDGEVSTAAIARVVITARRDQVDAAGGEIPRIVVTGRRANTVQALASARP